LTAVAGLRDVDRVPGRWIVALLLLWGPLALAQAPVVQGQGDVRYVSGGIGLGERLALAAMHAEFNVHMSFAVKRTGNFLADVAVHVEDAAGRDVLDAVSEGPWLYVRLATGRYRLRATYAGASQTRAFEVRAGRHTELYLYWDDPAAAEGRGMEPERATPAERRQ
jgi:hypothetical protein